MESLTPAEVEQVAKLGERYGLAAVLLVVIILFSLFMFWQILRWAGRRFDKALDRVDKAIDSHIDLVKDIRDINSTNSNNLAEFRVDIRQFHGINDQKIAMLVEIKAKLEQLETLHPAIKAIESKLAELLAELKRGDT